TSGTMCLAPAISSPRCRYGFAGASVCPSILKAHTNAHARSSGSTALQTVRSDNDESSARIFQSSVNQLRGLEARTLTMRTNLTRGLCQKNIGRIHATDKRRPISGPRLGSIRRAFPILLAYTASMKQLILNLPDELSAALSGSGQELSRAALEAI